ncbi:MAG: GyrI-like domain-containing protein [Patescibacteria group bacterium]|jgi:hypothetical protein
MKAFIPEITKLNDRKVLTVTSIGDPNKVTEPFMKALYGAAYYAKMKVYKPKGIKMELGKLSALWPDAHLKPKDKWTGIWGVVVPNYVTEKDIIQKDPKIPVKIVVWQGGEYAEILHLGPYSEEEPTIKKLHDFIKEQGYKIAGDHEEEYLTSPDAKNQKTVIRYRIKKV